jgi:hypothetical protein
MIIFRKVTLVPRIASLVACAGVIALLVPAVAAATTGTHTDKKTKVTITNRGVSWAPPLRTLHMTTGTTLKVSVVNTATQRHWFKLGKRQTKVLKQGGTEVFFFSFSKPGKVSWLTGLGSVSSAGFHGTIKVTFPQQFN